MNSKQADGSVVTQVSMATPPLLPIFVEGEDIRNSSFSLLSGFPHRIKRSPLPVCLVSTAAIEERCKEFAENVPLNVTERLSTATVITSGREIINTENRASASDKIKKVIGHDGANERARSSGKVVRPVSPIEPIYFCLS
jgi:hypothetical protein